MVQANIVPILKNDKPPEAMENYRPISLINVDIEIYSSFLAERLKLVLHDLIHFDQVGFIPGGDAANNTRRMIDVLDYAHRRRIPLLTMSLDAEKVFDRVGWGYMMETLRTFGFTGWIYSAILALYRAPSARVVGAGLCSDWFDLHNGTRQGCPLSPLLYVLSLEPLATILRQNKNITGLQFNNYETKLSLYANDVVVFLTKPLTSLSHFMTEIEQYSAISNYKINWNKTTVQALHTDPNTINKIREEYMLDISRKTFDYLGIKIPDRIENIMETNFAHLMNENGKSSFLCFRLPNKIATEMVQRRTMQSLFLLLLFLFTITKTTGKCFTFECSAEVMLTRYQNLQNCSLLKWSEFSKCLQLSTLILSNNSIQNVETSESTFKSLKIMDMSNNELETLPGDFLHDAVDLLELYLNENMLYHLPNAFLENSTKLRILKLEGNRLSSVPGTIFHQSLLNVTVDCTCNVASSIDQIMSKLCTSNSTCRLPFIDCKSGSRWSSVEDFYEKECRKPNLLALYIAMPIVLVVLILGTVACIKYKNKMKSTDLESKEIPDMSSTHEQPRYQARNKMSITTASDQMTSYTRDYENVMVTDHNKNNEIKPYEYLKSEPQYSKRVLIYPAEEDIYLESDVNEGDQPIYSNTQPSYHNYPEPGNVANEQHGDEDVYILPDQ
ncbi:LOW QUALITY PROTEIN: uncharacterized protein RCH25_036216 [Pelodytes ibericus]